MNQQTSSYADYLKQQNVLSETEWLAEQSKQKADAGKFVTVNIAGHTIQEIFSLSDERVLSLVESIGKVAHSGLPKGTPPGRLLHEVSKCCNTAEETFACMHIMLTNLVTGHKPLTGNMPTDFLKFLLMLQK